MPIERLELEGSTGVGALLLELSSGNDSALLLESSTPDSPAGSLALLGVGILLSFLGGGSPVGTKSREGPSATVSERL